MASSPPIVAEPGGLTAAWLTDALSAAGLDVSVRAVEVRPLGTGQMASCHRIELTYDEGEGPARLVAKLPSEDPEVRATVAPSYRTEVGFYRELAPRLPIDAPPCYFADFTDDGASFTLLLEDMAPAEAGDQLTGCTAEQARDAVVAVAGLHAGSWGDEEIAALEWLIPPMTALVDLLGPVLGDALQGFLARRELSAPAADVFRQFTERFAAWVTRRPAPWSLVHNDYRLDNLLFAAAGAAAGRVTAVDWQSLSTGLPLRDVAFLLGTGLRPEDRRAHEREIVGAYHQRLETLGVTGYDAGRCFEDYRHALFQGPFICIVGEAFAAQTDRGVRMFTAMAERSAAAIRELEALDLLDGDG